MLRRGFKIALVQLSVGADKAKNVAAAVSEIHKAKEQGAHIVALPECFNSPYGTKFFSEYAEEVPSGETCRSLSRAAAEAGVCVVGGTLPERCGDRLYNTCTVWDATGKLLAYHRKMHLFDIDIPNKITFKESEVLNAGDHITTFQYQGVTVGVAICYDLRFGEMAHLMAKQGGCLLLIIPTFKESEVLSAGDHITTFQYQGVTVGVAICYDLRFGEMAHLMAKQGGCLLLIIPTFKESEVLSAGDHITTFQYQGVTVGVAICYDLRFGEMAHLMAKQGCSVLIYPAAFNMTTGPKHWELLARARANDEQLWVALVSPARDTEADYVAWGHSTLVDPWANVVAKLDEKPGTLLADIDVSTVEEVRSQIPVRVQRRTDVYDTVLKTL